MLGMNFLGCAYMIVREKDGIKWLEFEQLQEFSDLVHGVFLRHGGVSTAPYGSLNLGGGSGDDLGSVTENRQIVANILGIKELMTGFFVHGDQVACMPHEKELTEKGCDGLATAQRDLGLMVTHADCQAAIFFDPIRKAVANVHCGWRGSVQNIYANTVRHLKERYNSRPEDLLVCISPSLGPESAEFIHYKTELPEVFQSFQVRPNYFDFWGISKMQLEECGIQAAHIEVAQQCTFRGEGDFFSYRRNKKTGRHGTVVALKER